MSLAPYRRHRRDCKAGHTEELRTSEYDERKKGWKQGSPKYANVARPGGLGFASAQGVRSVRLSSGSCLAFVRGASMQLWRYVEDKFQDILSKVT